MNVQTRTPEAAAPVLKRERDGEIAIVVLNRPRARNSLSEDLLKALAAAWTEIAADKSRARRGAGGRRPGFLRRP